MADVLIHNILTLFYIVYLYTITNILINLDKLLIKILNESGTNLSNFSPSYEKPTSRRIQKLGNGLVTLI